jgi:hypothetical protein
VNAPLTTHAEARWRERFPDLDALVVWQGSKRTTKNQSRRITMKCRGRETLPPSGFHYRLNLPARVVFVVNDRTGKIITVFPYTGSRTDRI